MSLAGVLSWFPFGPALLLLYYITTLEKAHSPPQTRLCFVNMNFQYKCGLCMGNVIVFFLLCQVQVSNSWRRVPREGACGSRHGCSETASKYTCSRLTANYCYTCNGEWTLTDVDFVVKNFIVYVQRMEQLSYIEH